MRGKILYVDPPMKLILSATFFVQRNINVPIKIVKLKHFSVFFHGQISLTNWLDQILGAILYLTKL